MVVVDDGGGIAVFGIVSHGNKTKASKYKTIIFPPGFTHTHTNTLYHWY